MSVQQDCPSGLPEQVSVEIFGTEVTADVLDTTLDASAGGQQAVADGGVGITDIQFDPRGSPIFEDEIIELGGDDYDGQAVSFNKVRELWLEQTSTEEMSMQEERGFLAGRSRKDMKRWALKILIIGGLVALGGLIGPELVQAAFGGGGGGGESASSGGGFVPLMISSLVML